MVSKPLEPRRQRSADQFDEQVQVRVPAILAVLVCKPEEARDFAMDCNPDDQRRADMQFGQAPQLGAGGLGARRRIVDLDDLEVTEPADQPGPVIETLPTENLGRALGEAGLRGIHRLEIPAIVRHQCKKRRIASGRVGQLGDIGLQNFPVAIGREILKIDGDLGLKCVYGAASAFSGARSALPDTRCSDGVGRVHHG